MSSSKKKGTRTQRAKYLTGPPQNQPEEISSVIGSIIENTAVDVDLRHGELVDGWAAFAPGDWVLGAPVGVRDQTLLVVVPDGATASLLRYQTRPLIEAISQRYGQGVIASVRVSVDRPKSGGTPRE
ncbi:MAG: DUF721 domain-containing protein [Acidimicrobiia bacterium]